MTPKQFKEIRKSLGWGQATLAKALGRSVASVCYYERGGLGIDKLIADRMLHLQELHKEGRLSVVQVMEFTDIQGNKTLVNATEVKKVGFYILES